VIELILFVLVGAGLFVSLYLVGRRSPRAEGSAQELLNARQALSTLQEGLLSPEMVERIFASEDLEYVSGSPVQVRRLFLAERRGIALSWVTQMRTQILSLKKFHLGSARFHAGLRLRTEMRLAAEFVALLCMCRALQLALYFRGPYAAPAMVGRATAAAGRVCEVSGKSLSFLKPGAFDSFSNESARNPTGTV
jgi:hypothetical protein